MEQAVAQDQDLTDKLVAALRQDEFILYGQKIAPLSPVGEEQPFQEILIRFQEEEAKLLPPGSFFPVLEDCGLLPYVDRWVVSRILRWVYSALTIKPDWPVPHNSVNLSVATLTDRNFMEYVRKHLQAAAVPAGTLSFEVTCDSAVEQMKHLQSLMTQLRPHGCRLVLARFDGGDNAFKLLPQLGPEFVKLSPGLVRALNHGKAGMERVETTNHKCHELGIKTIAEHVESDETIAQLRALGVDYGQGFAIQGPQPLV
jgi:EAL domain-containing protein (putative c-di-GMP-specific phosphodiesterase class I)